MPELPEVETIARGLAKRVTGDVVESVWLGQKSPLKSPASEVVAVLEQSRVAAVRRMGKHIVFDLEREGDARTSSPTQSHKSQWIVHLGMTGHLQVCEPQTEVEKHTHAILRL